jgi:hypothetical protein
MSVYQTREHFLGKYGRIVDNPRVGAELTKAYWQPGNSALFLDLVQGLTGKPLSGDAWVQSLQQDTEALVGKERKEYAEAVAAAAAEAEGGGAPAVDLGMRMVLVHGDHVISDSVADGSFENASAKFKTWIAGAFPAA